MLKEVVLPIAPSQNERVGAENTETPKNDVGANVGAILLRDPRRLYRFGDVGMVGMFNGAKKIKVLATFEIDGEIKSVNIVLPEGNWIFVNVGAMGFDQKGYMSFDNPYVGAKDNAPTSKEE